MIDPQSYITFADEKVAKIVAENWGDGTGIDIEHFAAITDIGTVFRGTDIERFDELAMTGVVSLSDYAFAACSNLQSINLSKISVFGKEALSGCSALTVLNLPSVTQIGDSAFASCNSVEAIYCGEGLTKLGSSSLMLSACKWYVIAATTPPSRATHVFGKGSLVGIYVPDDAAANYRRFWVSTGDGLSSKYMPMSELPEEAKAILNLTSI